MCLGCRIVNFRFQTCEDFRPFLLFGLRACIKPPLEFIYIVLEGIEVHPIVDDEGYLAGRQHGKQQGFLGKLLTGLLDHSAITMG